MPSLQEINSAPPVMVGTICIENISIEYRRGIDDELEPTDAFIDYPYSVPHEKRIRNAGAVLLIAFDAMIRDERSTWSRWLSDRADRLRERPEFQRA